MTDAKYEQLVKIFVLHEIQRQTIPEVAAALDLTEYAVRQLKKDPDYDTVRRERREEFHALSLSRVHVLADMAIGGLQDLALGARSEFVRFNAAKQLLDYTGLGQQALIETTDDRQEVSAFLRGFLDKHAVTISIEPQMASQKELPVVRDGGLLPDFVDASQDSDNSDSSWRPS